MAYEIGYVDGLQGTWVAEPIPVSNAPISPYNTAPTGGYAPSAPVNWQPAVGNPTPVLDTLLDSQTYTTPTGAKGWLPTASEQALVDEVTRNPYSGLDELVEAGGRAPATKGIQQLPYVGDVVGGAVEGALVYGETGSVSQGVGAGVGSTAGGLAGSAVGGAIGAIGGPAGILAGGIIGGAVGSAIGGSLGQALGRLFDDVPEDNRNGAEIPGDYPYTGEDNDGQLFQIYWQYKYYGGDWTNGEWVGVTDVYPYESGGGDSTGCPGGSSFKYYQMGTRGLASGCGAEVRNIRMSPWPTATDKPLRPVTPSRPNTPKFDNPNLPKSPIFDFPEPVTGTPRFPDRDPSGRPIPRPTADPDPSPNPVGQPTYRPIDSPVTTPTIPSFPDFGQPGNKPDSKPQPDPYTFPDPNNKPPTDPPEEPTEECDPCKKIEQIRQKLDDLFSREYGNSISLFPCEEGAPNSLVATGQGLDGISSQITILANAVTEVWEKVKCPPVVDTALPESWAIKTSRTKPQYVITFGPTDGSRSRWSSSVPWPKYTNLASAMAQIQYIEIHRGNVQLSLVNEDNSKTVFNVLNEGEADQVTAWVNSMQDDDVVANQNPKQTKGIKNKINPNVVRPISVKYYANGQEDMVPTWVFKFNPDGSKEAA